MRLMTTLFAATITAAATASAGAQTAPLVMIDPGHGGDQPGVTAAGFEEKDLVFAVAQVLVDEYGQSGLDARLTRTGDYDVDNGERRAMAEQAGAVLFVSLHFNRNEDVEVNGIEIYVNLDDARSMAAANAMAHELAALGMPVVVEGRNWAFLKSPTVPSVMIEAGFLSNPSDRERIVSEQFALDLAAAMVVATREFLATP